MLMNSLVGWNAFSVNGQEKVLEQKDYRLLKIEAEEETVVVLSEVTKAFGGSESKHAESKSLVTHVLSS